MNDKEPENWLVWGLILRKVGQYQSAQHKFNRALKIDPNNTTAKQELLLLSKIVELDSQISLEQAAMLKKMRPNYDLPEGYDYRGGSIIRDMKHRKQMNNDGEMQQSDDWSVQMADGARPEDKVAKGEAGRANGCSMYEM